MSGKEEQTVICRLRAEEEKEERGDMETRGVIYIARPSLFGQVRLGQVRVKAGTTSMSAVMVNTWNFKPEMHLNYLGNE